MNLYREAFLNIKKFPSTFWFVILATFINQAGNMAFVFILPYTTQQLGFSLSQGAVAFGIISAFMLLSGLFAGNLIDRFGPVRMIIGAVYTNGFILLIIPFIHHYYFLLIMCALWGTTFGIYRPSSYTLVSYFSSERLHKITFSIYRLAQNLGMSIGPAIGGYIVAYSFSLIFFMNGIANIIVGIILTYGLISFLRKRDNTSVKQDKVFTIKWLKTDAILRLFFIGMIPVSMVFYQHESTLPVFLNKNLGFPLSFYGWLFTINTLMIVFFELLLNIATINWSYRINFIIGTLFITIGFFGIYFATTMWHIVMLTMIWTIGEMILYPSASSYIAEIAPENRRGSYMSLYSISTNLGLLIGPWIGAIIMQQLGYSILWIMCGVWGIISIVIFGFIDDPKIKK